MLAKQGKVENEYHYKEAGFNYKMSNLNASLGNEQCLTLKNL